MSATSPWTSYDHSPRLDPEAFSIFEPIQLALKERDSEALLTNIEKVSKEALGQVAFLLLENERRSCLPSEKKEDSDLSDSLERTRLIMSALKKNNPEIKRYFQIGLTTDVLKPAAINLLANQILNRSHLEFSCKICPNLLALTESLKELAETKEVSRQIYIVRPTKGSPHVTPVLVEWSPETGAKFLISDSFGTKLLPPGNSVSNLLAAIQPLTIFPRKTFFIAREGRQTDSTNCPIFSLKDAIYFHENPTIMSLVSDTLPKIDYNTGEDSLGDPTYLVDLPEEMMAYSQVQLPGESDERCGTILDRFLHYQALLVEALVCRTAQPLLT
jgi:hypothetical protein